MSINRRQFLRTTVAGATSAATLELWPDQLAQAQEVITWLKKLQPILVAGVQVGATLAGVGPLTPLVTAVGTVVMTEIFNAKTNPTPTVIDNTQGNWEASLKNYLDDKFKEQDRTTLAKKLFNHIDYLKNTIKPLQLAKMKNAKVGMLNLLPAEDRKFLSDRLLNNADFDLKATVNDLITVGAPALPAFIVAAGMVLMNERQLAVLDNPVNSAHIDVFHTYADKYNKHLKATIDAAYGNITDVAVQNAARAANEKILSLWNFADTNFAALASGRVLGADRWTEWQNSGDALYLPKVAITLDYRWWATDRFGILRNYDTWRSADGKHEIKITTDVQGSFVGSERKRKTMFCEQITVKSTAGDGFWDDLYAYPIYMNGPANHTFFTRWDANKGVVYIPESAPNEKSYREKLADNLNSDPNKRGLCYDGPFQIRFFDPSLGKDAIGVQKSLVFNPVTAGK